MITSLVRTGKKVGITALSHKVIRNLLDEVVKAAGEEHTAVWCVQKVSEPSDGVSGSIAEILDNASILNRLQSGAAQVAAGTAWLWACQEFIDAVDVLFVDEAGQLTLADVLAVSQAAGSPSCWAILSNLASLCRAAIPKVSMSRRLTSPRRAQDHPPGAGSLSRFLDQTRRLHPDVCAFTSELFYEGRLTSRWAWTVKSLTARDRLRVQGSGSCRSHTPSGPPAAGLLRRWRFGLAHAVPAKQITALADNLAGAQCSLSCGSGKLGNRRPRN